jgi:hypothetical protein
MRRPLLSALASVAIITIVFAFIVTALVPVQVASASDHCLFCHPQAHAAGWEQTHATVLSDGQDSMATCSVCHQAADCETCHSTTTGQ